MRGSEHRNDRSGAEARERRDAAHVRGAGGEAAVVRAVTLKIRVPKAFDPEAFCDQISQSLGRKGFVRLDVYLSRSRRHVKVGWS